MGLPRTLLATIVALVLFLPLVGEAEEITDDTTSTTQSGEPTDPSLAPEFATSGPMADTGIGAVVEMDAQMRTQMAGQSTENQFAHRKDYWGESGGGYVLGLLGVDFSKLVTSGPMRAIWTVLFIFSLGMYFSRMSNPIEGGNKHEMLLSLFYKLLFLPLIVNMGAIYGIAETARSQLSGLIVDAMTQTISESGAATVVVNDAVLGLFETADPLRREFEVARIESIAKAFNARSPAFGSTAGCLAAALALKTYGTMASSTSGNPDLVSKYNLTREQFDYISKIATLDPATIKYGPNSVVQSNLRNIPILLYALGDTAYSGKQFPETQSSGDSNSWWGRNARLLGFGDDPDENGYTLGRFRAEPYPLIHFMEENGAVELRREALWAERTPTAMKAAVQDYRDLVFQATLEHIDRAWLKQIADYNSDDIIFHALGGNIADSDEVIRLIADTINTPRATINPVTITFERLTEVVETMNRWLAVTLPFMLSLMFVLAMEVAVFFIYLTYPLWFLKNSKAFPGWVQTLVTSVLFTFVFFALVTVAELGIAQLMSWIHNGFGYNIQETSGGRMATSTLKLPAAVFALVFRLVFYTILAFKTPAITKKILEGQSFIGGLAMAGVMSAMAAGVAATGVGVAAYGATSAAGTAAAAKMGGMGLGAAYQGGGIKGAASAVAHSTGHAVASTGSAIGRGARFATASPLKAGIRTASAAKRGTVGAVRLGQASLRTAPGRAATGALREAAHAAVSGGDMQTYMQGRGSRARQESILHGMQKQEEMKNRDTAKAPNPSDRREGSPDS